MDPGRARLGVVRLGKERGSAWYGRVRRGLV